MSLFKLISCNVFMREACWCIARSPHVVDVEFTELGEHVHSESLRQIIQSKIQAAESNGKTYDAILILFGVCGNATIGLTAGKTRLVIPRAHDCCTILLGSRQKFEEHFKDNPSTPFGSSGYLDRGEYYLRMEDGKSQVHIGDAYASYVEQYGEENAQYIWESMHPPAPEGQSKKAVFIELPQTSSLGYAKRFVDKAQADGKEVEKLQGDIRLIENLIFGRWTDDEYLVVEPGQKVAGVYDWTQVIRAQDDKGA